TVLHTAFVLGLMHAGTTTLSLRGPRVPAGIRADLVLTDLAEPRHFSDGATVLKVDRSWLEGDGARVPVSCRGKGEDIFRIILTSGSTGIAKGVPFSHRLTAARAAHYMYSRGPRSAHCARFFCDLEISTSPGFSYTLSVFSRGATIFFLGPDPADIL